MKGGRGPGPAPIPPQRSLRRLRWSLTVWFTLVLAVVLTVTVVAVSAVAAPGYASRSGGGGAELGWSLAVLGGLAVALFAPVAWILLGYVLAPVSHSLSAQESFLGTAAHDLKTPLATLGALLETARRDPDADARDDALERAARLAHRSGDTMEDLLLRARLTAGVIEASRRPVRLDLLVERVIADLAGTELAGTELAGTGPGSGTDDGGTTRLSVDLDGHSITMRATPTVALIDPALAERAASNLVHNALRHGHLPGRPARIEVTVEADGDRALITVGDEGPGLRPPVARTGLGLSVVRWCVHAHGGALLLGTGPEPGTRIRLSLPLNGCSR
ncbi:HAMP domain-containing histidine kinase [Streptomyces bathyalis]|uniref:Sensor-like histidine kinase SenX3 n=1 Tax=Streptomyces bathyalis TaxID=2710756 RepID=A0A7T1T6W2_9ACTN|nr:HAMP domain-containing sensor histidine kinase [Streptomyces bathyalis]QPP07483.1 HAMP domain-containing histidine kinase [Streptomyces bathyalis]